MSRDTAQKHDEIGSIQDLVSYFHAGSKPASARAVGMEHEKFGLRIPTDAAGALCLADAQTVPYEGGIEAVMQRLVSEYGWSPVFDAGHLMALERDGGAVTLEPGGQFELSGAPFASLHDNARELFAHLREAHAVGQSLGIRWLLMGAQPLHSVDQIPWMPKSRYRIMSRYLPTRGSLAHAMMKMTCTVQANFDYTSEADAAEILRAILSVTSIASALFASSPFEHKALSPYIDRRCHIWTDTDPDRSGFVRAMLSPGFSFADYVEYLLDIPMICIRRDPEGYIDATGRTFRQYLLDGLPSATPGAPPHRASIGDWEMHLSMVWPEVRMKRYIEVRGCDVVPADLMLSMTALWKGLLYDPTARASAIALTADLSFEQRLALHSQMIERGLSGRSPDGRSLLDLGLSLTQLASDGLSRQYPTEVPFLAPLIDQVLAPGQSLAMQMRDRFNRDGLASALDLAWLTST